MGDAASVPDEVDGRAVVLAALSGSHNYNLDSETSDRDYKVFIAPTFDDLYGGRMVHKEWIGTETDILVHDIRKLPDLLWKSNPSFMEIMFTQERIIPDTFASGFVEALYGMRDSIAVMNLPYFWDSSMGIMTNKMKHLEGTSGTADLVSRYGYDTKQAMHAVRILRVLEKFADNGFTDFGEAIWFPGRDRDEMLAIKNGSMSEQEFRQYADQRLRQVEGLRPLYKDAAPNRGTCDEVDSIVKELVRKGLRTYDLDQ